MNEKTQDGERKKGEDTKIKGRREIRFPEKPL